MDFSRIWHLYRLVANNQRMSKRRHPMYERNMAMKILHYVLIAFAAVYLFYFGIVFYFVFEDASIEQYDMLNGGMIFFIVVDFLSRFAFQETPAQEVKPYKLLPIPERFLLKIFILRVGLSPYNLFSGLFLVPYSFLSIPLYHGWTGVLGFLLGWWLVFVMNSYWYLIWRSFVNKHVLYLTIPLALYAILIYCGYFMDESNQWLFNFTMHLGQGFIGFDILSLFLLAISIVLLFYVNVIVQHSMVYSEISKVASDVRVRSSEIHLLNRFGIVGQYIKLELKSVMRNRVVRNQFLYGFCCMMMLCALFAFTDVYDRLPFMKAYICVYCFSCLGVMILTSVMCAEGNYIDGLMSRKESVLSLLCAKYYFNSVLTIFPLLAMLMPIIEGKVSVIDALGCMFFTIGVIFPFLFQLAVYNNTTLHLNEKLTKAGRSTKAQTLVAMLAMFVPMLIMYVLMTILGSDASSIAMFVIGVAGLLLHKYWLRNIYVRFMRRRYENMAGFRDTI